MRYYKIVITDPSGNPVLPSSLMGLQLTSLTPDGQFNIGALNVEFDIPVFRYHTPDGSGYLRIWGLGLQDIGGSFNLNPTANDGKYHQIQIYGGMSKGLPLANPAQQGLLLKGSIYQAFGNWSGTEQTVDIIFTAPTGTSDAPVNLVLNWVQNSPLSQALQQTLSTAFPDAKLTINISSRLTLNYDQPGFYGTLEQLATYVNGISTKIIKDSGYPGVSITYDGSSLLVFDTTQPDPAPTPILFTDLIGQPTWISPFTMQFHTVLRGDLDINQIITLPQTLATNTAAAQPGLVGNPSNKLTFSGNFRILKIHHYGNFRQADASSWCTVIDAVQDQAA